MSDLITIDKYRSVWNELFTYDPTPNPTLWNLLGEVFDGDDDPTVTNIKKHLLNRIASFSPIYSTTTVEDKKFFHSQMVAWGDMYLIAWKKAWDAYTTEYDPLENYHRTDYKQEVLDGASTVDNTTTAHVAPESAETFYNTGKSIVDGETTTDNTTTVNAESKGNVGVTTSQQMLQAEMDLRSVNFINTYIITPFVREFCIAVY